MAFSMPGALRRGKSKLFGTNKMSDDPLEAKSLELEELEAILAVINTCMLKVVRALEELSAAPYPLLEPLQRFFPQERREALLAARFASCLGMFSQRSREAGTHVEAVKISLAKLNAQNAVTRSTVQERDKQHQTMMHYQKKVESFQGQASKSNSSAKLDDKLNRNMQKAQAADQVFQVMLRDSTRQLDEVLCSRFEQVGEVLAKISGYYAAVFDASESLCQEMRFVSEGLVASRAAPGTPRGDMRVSGIPVGVVVDIPPAPPTSGHPRDANFAGTYPAALASPFRPASASSQRPCPEPWPQQLATSGHVTQSVGARGFGGYSWQQPRPLVGDVSQGVAARQPVSPWGVQREVRSCQPVLVADFGQPQNPWDDAPSPQPSNPWS